MRGWLPVVFWMAVLFVASTDLGGTKHTSRILVPLLRWLVPDISRAAVNQVQLGVRKTGHTAAYALLAGLAWRARRRMGDISQSWRVNDAVFALLVATLYAASDEWHQTFTATRQGTLTDVALDVFGASLGLTAIWLWGRWRRRW